MKLNQRLLPLFTSTTKPLRHSPIKIIRIHSYGSQIAYDEQPINKPVKKRHVVPLNGNQLRLFPRPLDDFLRLDDTDLFNLSDRIIDETEYESRKIRAGRYVALDCEFVGVGPGKISSLARITIVNYYGFVLLDEFVKPTEKVTQWRTFVSGIRPKNLRNAPTKEELWPEICRLLENKIIVGHRLESDFGVMQFRYPGSMIRDTSRHKAFREYLGSRDPPSLKRLAKELLGLNIQEGEHSSVEDAQTAMLLFRLNRRYF